MSQAVSSANIAVADLALVRDIENSLRTYQVDGEPALANILDPLRSLLNARVAHTHGIEEVNERLRTAFVHSHLPSSIRAEMDQGLARERAETNFSAFNLRCPEPEQRNRAIRLEPTKAINTQALHIVRRFGALHNQVRVLVCEGPSLLAWVGGFREEPFTTREVELLDRVVAPLRERLSFERRIQRSSIAAAALDMALEQLAAAGFVLDGAGRILHANTAGRSRLATDGRVLARRLADARTGNDPDFAVRVTTARGQAPVYLVTASSPGATQQFEAAAALWRLTPRQREVLACVIQGHSNARIAAELEIAERTVEVHISAILDRAQCNSRAELIAAVMRMG